MPGVDPGVDDRPAHALAAGVEQADRRIGLDGLAAGKNGVQGRAVAGDMPQGRDAFRPQLLRTRGAIAGERPQHLARSGGDVPLHHRVLQPAAIDFEQAQPHILGGEIDQADERTAAGAAAFPRQARGDGAADVPELCDAVDRRHVAQHQRTHVPGRVFAAQRLGDARQRPCFVVARRGGRVGDLLLPPCRQRQQAQHLEKIDRRQQVGFVGGEFDGRAACFVQGHVDRFS
jgi:hypothetical protein